MKLQLSSNPQEIFDAPRGIALALIATGAVEAYKEPISTNPADFEVKWSIYGSADDLSRIPTIKAECPLCHAGQTMGSVQAFVHCRGKRELPPDDIAASLNKLISLRRAKQKKEPEIVPAHIVKFLG